ncbi:hypothetical protein HanRHA438_Chr17g0789551 [Helianthus annuus]|nr:hypothetical protein HanRHA438_Chr17g0789551 [Helianthus annuus]
MGWFTNMTRLEGMNQSFKSPLLTAKLLQQHVSAIHHGMGFSDQLQAPEKHYHTACMMRKQFHK